MAGIEYMLYEVMEPHLFVIRKQKRDGPEKVTPMLTYYVLDGSIYQAPQLCNVFAARVVSSHVFPFVLVIFLQKYAYKHVSTYWNGSVHHILEILVMSICSI